jgi:uncharacterized membrane protein
VTNGIQNGIQNGGEYAATTRIEAFSDCVFSIVITLLILDIRVPPTASLHHRTLQTALLAQWPSYAAYIVSFLLVGGVWANHHVSSSATSPCLGRCSDGSGRS